MKADIFHPLRPPFYFLLYTAASALLFIIFPPLSVIPIYLERKGSSPLSAATLSCLSGSIFSLFVFFAGGKGDEAGAAGLFIPFFSYMSQAGIPGLLFSEFMVRGARIEWVIGGVALVATLLVFSGLLLQASMTGKGLKDTIQEVVSGPIAEKGEEARVKEGGGDGRGGLLDRAEISYRLFAGITLSLHLISFWLIFHIIRLTGFSSRGEDLKTWRLPNQVIWLLMVCITLVITRKEWLLYPGLNLILVLMVLYMWQGISVVAHYLESKGVHPILRWVTYTVVFYLLPLTAIFGAFETFFDFRKSGRGFKL